MQTFLDFFVLALTIFFVPILCTRCYRMGLIGMRWPVPCPPNIYSNDFTGVTCCEHNKCPERPTAEKKFVTQPWRCPQCKTWWATREVRGNNRMPMLLRGVAPFEWTKVSEQVGDGFITKLD